ncbi:MAG TPA: CBS domain-containing protein [Candidatus Limnocylindrales bacterium]|nr:CBS domain-containing protein [Candidatus Limnocylindrales bacterium]
MTGKSAVASLMTPRPIVVTVDTSLAEVAELLDRGGISGVPVVDLGGYLVGVLSRTDLVRARTNEALWGRWPTLTARDLMSSPAVTIAATAPIEEAARLMEREGVHRLVVVGDDGETPIGILSIGDLVHEIAAHREEEWSLGDIGGRRAGGPGGDSPARPWPVR